MTDKSFWGNLSFIIFVNLLIKPFYIFGVDRAVQMTVNQNDGEGTYGHFFSLFNFSYLFYILLDLGITDYNKRNVAQNPALIKTEVPNFLAVKLVLAGVYFGLMFMVAYLVGYNREEMLWLIPLGINQLFISLIFYFRSNIAGLFMFKMDGIFQVLDRLVMIFLCSVLLWGGVVEKFQVSHFIYAQSFSYGITALLSGAVVFYHAGFPKININWDRVKMIIKESVPFALLVLMMTLYNRMDSIMIERLLPIDGKQEADVYARSFRLLDAVQGFALLFAALVMPMFARMLKNGERTEKLVETSFKAILLFSITTGLACFFYREPIMSMLYKEQGTVYAAWVFGLIMFTFIPIGSVYIFGTLMTANRNMKELNTIAICGVTLNVILNYFFIQSDKALGATIATLLTQSLAALAHILWAIKLLKLELPKKMWFSIFGYVAACGTIYYGSTFLPIDWTISFILAGLFSVGAGFLLKMINLQEVFSLKN